MNNTVEKSQVISKILKAAKKTGSTKHFDLLHEKSEGYLIKLLETCKNLKKAK